MRNDHDAKLRSGIPKLDGCYLVSQNVLWTASLSVFLDGTQEVLHERMAN